MSLFFGFVDEFRCQAESKFQTSTLRVSFYGDADCSILNVESNWDPLSHAIASHYVINDVSPVKQADVLDHFSSIQAKGNSLKI